MPGKPIYIATTNPGKLRDFAAATQSFGGVASEFNFEPMPCMDRIPAAPENEATFEGNARAKAIYYSRMAPGFDILADDSGLEVDALDGIPGVRSARWAADERFSSTGNIDEDNNLLLLDKLASVPEEKRTARYRCVLALANSGNVLLTGEGSVEGHIAAEPRGNGGFGYDPLFYLPELEKTMAEIDPVEKNGLSHRGRALQALVRTLQEMLA